MSVDDNASNEPCVCYCLKLSSPVCRSREGKDLVASDKVKISSTADGVYTLRLCDLTEADSGKYTIKAGNDAGQTSCTATLLVHGQ